MSHQKEKQPVAYLKTLKLRRQSEQETDSTDYGDHDIIVAKQSRYRGKRFGGR